MQRLTCGGGKDSNLYAASAANGFTKNVFFVRRTIAWLFNQNLSHTMTNRLSRGVMHIKWTHLLGNDNPQDMYATLLLTNCGGVMGRECMQLVT